MEKEKSPLAKKDLYIFYGNGSIKLKCITGPRQSFQESHKEIEIINAKKHNRQKRQRAKGERLKEQEAND